MQAIEGFSVYHFILPTLILLVGTVDDLRTKKIHNKLVLILLAVAALYQFIFFGSSGLRDGFMASILAIFLFLPLVLARALGAGDMKLMMAFGMSTYWVNVLWTSIYSLVWGALFGIIYALTHNQLKSVLVNTWMLAQFKKDEVEAKVLKIPFTVALLCGWLQQVVFTYFKIGVTLW